jgi:hypothetical protein
MNTPLHMAKYALNPKWYMERHGRILPIEIQRSRRDFELPLQRCTMGLSGSLDSLEQFLSIQYESLHDSRPDDTFPGDMQELSIFSRFCSRLRIQILSV